MQQKNDSLKTELCKTDIPKILEISDVVQEAKEQKSFFFKYSIDCKPGQFIMVWIPGLDEKPMAVSYWKKNEFAFTSKAIGKWTNSLDMLKKGDKVGIRGPYGSCFPAKHWHGERVSVDERARHERELASVLASNSELSHSTRASHVTSCVVGGGVGMASVSTLIDVLENPIIINGARSKDYLLYLKRYKNKNMIAATDDGSFGRKGFTTDILHEVLSNNKKIKIVYTCGQEIMMKKVFEICQKHKVECEASLERMMKCGFGICGACMINDRLVCIDGPIFNLKQLNKLSEFGKFARIKTGRKVTLKEYYSRH